MRSPWRMILVLSAVLIPALLLPWRGAGLGDPAAPAGTSQAVTFYVA